MVLVAWVDQRHHHFLEVGDLHRFVGLFLLSLLLLLHEFEQLNASHRVLNHDDSFDQTLVDDVVFGVLLDLLDIAIDDLPETYFEDLF